jgi:hypothetical protein
LAISSQYWHRIVACNWCAQRTEKRHRHVVRNGSTVNQDEGAYADTFMVVKNDRQCGMVCRQWTRHARRWGAQITSRSGISGYLILYDKLFNSDPFL